MRRNFKDKQELQTYLDKRAAELQGAYACRPLAFTRPPHVLEWKAKLEATGPKSFTVTATKEFGGGKMVIVGANDGGELKVSIPDGKLVSLDGFASDFCLFDSLGAMRRVINTLGFEVAL